MAAQEATPHTDKDLASISEARTLARAARQAQPLLAELTQEQIDRIVTAMADAVTPHAEALARLAVDLHVVDTADFRNAVHNGIANHPVKHLHRAI